MRRRALVALVALAVAGCRPAAVGNEAEATGDVAAPVGADAAAALNAALPPIWDSATYLEVEVRATAPQLVWHERGVAIRIMGQRPMLDVHEEEYSVDPTLLKPAPKVIAPAAGATLWSVQFDCRNPGCIAVKSSGSHGTLEERRGGNIWLARDEAAAKRLAAALAAVIPPGPAG